MLDHIVHKLTASGLEATYDSNAKEILGEKIILAHIITECVEEFHGIDPLSFVDYIEGEPLISEIPVMPGETNSPHIHSGASQDSIPYEELVTYDIHLYVRLPNHQDLITIILDLEAQRKFHPGYDLITRGVYYGTRMVSSQMGVEFTGENYDNIKKVYSIWICFHVASRLENTMIQYQLTQNNLLGDPGELGRYDLMRVIFICLSEEVIEKQENYRLHRLLEVLFTNTLSIKEKKEILATEYHIPVSNNLERRINHMCNLGEGIYEDGYENGQRQNSISLLRLALSRFGQVPSAIYETCESITDPNTLISWVSIAFQASSLEEFLEKVQFSNLSQN